METWPPEIDPHVPRLLVWSAWLVLLFVVAGWCVGIALVIREVIRWIN